MLVTPKMCMVGATGSWGTEGVRSPADVQSSSNNKEVYWLTQWEVQESVLHVQLGTEAVQ